MTWDKRQTEQDRECSNHAAPLRMVVPMEVRRQPQHWLTQTLVCARTKAHVLNQGSSTRTDEVVGAKTRRAMRQRTSRYVQARQEMRPSA